MAKVLFTRQKAEILLAKLYPMYKVKLTTLTVDRMMKLATPAEIDFYYKKIIEER